MISKDPLSVTTHTPESSGDDEQNKSVEDIHA